MATSKKTKKSTAKKTSVKKTSVKKSPTKKSVSKKTPAKKAVAKNPSLLWSVKFTRVYALGALAILLLTTILWATLSARLQQSNADQLVNSYLFENANTFHKSLLPGQHSFLLKWPAFWLVHMMGSSGTAMIGTTVTVTLLTVTLFAYLLYRIDRRHLAFGTICLALASVLLLVPAQSYAGALLPVNMAMLATRNIEYVLFIAGLLLVIRWPRVKSGGFWLAVLCLGLVIASDQLFFTLSVGAAIISMLAYAFMRRWKLTQLSTKWLLAAVVAGLLASSLIAAITYFGIARVSSSASILYGLQTSPHGLALGVFYAAMGLATNLGANPAYDGTVLHTIPNLVQHRLTGIGGFSFLINASILLFAVFAATKQMIFSLLPRGKHTYPEDWVTKLTLMLLWVSLVSIGAFVVTNHYYAVDARYLTVCFFSLFVAVTAYVRQKTWSPERVVGLGAVLAFSVSLGCVFAVTNYQHQANALKETNDRNSLVAQALSHHPVDVLAGDYWRVIPTKQAAKTTLNVLPLATCLQPREVLSSQAWQPDLQKTRFAYLLTLDKGLTDYPTCTLDQAVTAYGRPNASAVIAGTLENPKEVLLFYDKGASQSSPSINAPAKPPATVVPIAIDQLPNTTCTGFSVLNIVAHEDDDLLFMNPDIARDIKAGHCVRTVYVTAGDAGSNEFYWLSREQGSQAAYSKMIGDDNALWVQRVVKVADKAFITVANPKNNPRISLVFMRLPDGNLHGQGFNSSNHESLEQLSYGQVPSLKTVTNQSEYSAQQLTDALAILMQTYQPSEIRSQADFYGHDFPDHSDHRAVGRLAAAAYAQYEKTQYEDTVTIPFKQYLGYPVRDREQNVFGEDLQQKEAAFLAYAVFDGGVCQNAAQCNRTLTYDGYLKRQYELGD